MDKSVKTINNEAINFTKLEYEKLANLLAKAEEFLSMVVEFDPIEERSNKICIVIRFALESYNNIHNSNLCSIKERENFAASNDNEEELKKLFGIKKNLSTNIPESSNSSNEKEESESRIKVEPEIDDIGLSEYKYIGKEENMSFEPLVDNDDVDSNISPDEMDELYTNEVESRTEEAGLTNDECSDDIHLDSHVYLESFNMNVESMENVDIDQLSTALNPVRRPTKEICQVIYKPDSDGSQKFYKCLLCDYYTDEKGNKRGYLRNHVSEVHDRIRKFQCPHCDYRASRGSILKGHIMAKHEKRKPYKCSQCDYECINPTFLKYHVSSKHNNIKPFKCMVPQCNYESAVKSTLKTHTMIVHDKVKNYRCEMCDYACFRKYSLNRHQERKHKDSVPP